MPQPIWKVILVPSLITLAVTLLRLLEKMASLGTLSAGLAHELNNPAAAAHRSSAHLRQALMDWQTLAEPLFQQAARTNQADWLQSLNAESYPPSTTPRDTNPLARIDRADRIQTWLEDRNISEAWELAPTLASSRWEPESLEEIHRNLQAAELGCSLVDIIRYVVASSSLYTLVDEVHQSTERISQIVNRSNPTPTWTRRSSRRWTSIKAWKIPWS